MALRADRTVATGRRGPAGDHAALEEGVGDCRQELVFIGQNLDFAAPRAAPDACLLDDAEMNLGIPGWQGLDDPSGLGHAA